MVTSSELRARARQKLGNNLFGNTWILAMVICLIASAIFSFSYSFSAVPALSLIVSLAELVIIGPLSFGVSLIFISLVRGKSEIEVGELFNGFKGNDFSRLLLLGLLQRIFIVLWSLLFVIPGIIKMYAYSQSYYLSVDHPDWDWKKCLDESQKMMNGKKWNLFCLDLSFIGWYIVGSICLGVGILFVMPYHETARAEFYEELQGQNATPDFGKVEM